MMNFKNEEAVSPVIGVILMVAITVILAAVIAAFVFGMSESIPDQKDVYVTTKLGVDTDSNPVMIVTLQGGKDIRSLTAVEYKGVGDGADGFVDVGSAGSAAFAAPFEVGDSGWIDLNDVEAGNTAHITIRGVFADGAVKILAERDYVGSPVGDA